MLCQLFIVQIRTPSLTIVFQLNISILHGHGAREDLTTPIIVEVVENLVDKEVGCGSVEMRAYQRAKWSLRAVRRSHSICRIDHPTHLLGDCQPKILRFQLNNVHGIMGEQLSKLLDAVILYSVT